MLYDLECLSSCSGVQLDDIMKTYGDCHYARISHHFVEPRTHYFEEGLGVHAASSSKVGAGLLQGLHGGANGVYHGHAGNKRKDCCGVKRPCDRRQEPAY